MNHFLKYLSIIYQGSEVWKICFFECYPKKPKKTGKNIYGIKERESLSGKTQEKKTLIEVSQLFLLIVLL